MQEFIQEYPNEYMIRIPMLKEIRHKKTEESLLTGSLVLMNCI
jgi:hypothetical protein